METEGRERDEGTVRDRRWPAALELLPVAWLALVGYAYGGLAFTPTGEDRMLLPGMLLLEQSVVPLLCLICVAGIITCTRFRSRRVSLTAARGESQDTS